MQVISYRTHSRPLDVHTWSEHADIDLLVDRMWSALTEATSTLPDTWPRFGAEKKVLKGHYMSL